MNFWSLLLKILGWKIYGENFISPRSVIAVAPHTSYLDGVIGRSEEHTSELQSQR